MTRHNVLALALYALFILLLSELRSGDAHLLLKAELPEVADVPCSRDEVTFHVSKDDEVANPKMIVLYSGIVISFGLSFVPGALTASEPYTRLKGVHPVPVRTVVRYAHRTLVLLDFEIVAPFSKRITGKLLTVIADDYFWNTEAANDVVPYKLEHLVASYCCYWLRLHPFGEIFDGDDQEFDSSGSFREWSYYVDSPLIEGPRARDAS
ncbi:hypothetical protein Tco_1526036 [Tanacetum coccineum]